MSVVIGATWRSGVILGADSLATTDSNLKMADQCPKLWRWPGMIVGDVGIPRLLQLYEYAKPPARHGMEWRRYMVKVLVPFLFRVARRGEYRIDAEKECSGLLIGVPSRLFQIECDQGNVLEPPGNAWADGHSAMARGSLFTTGKYPPSARSVAAVARARVRIALEATAAHSTVVGGSFIYEELRARGKR